LKALLKRSRDGLRRSNARARTLAKVIPVGFLVTDQSGVIKSVNPTALDLFRCRLSDLHSRSVCDFFLFDESFAKALSISNSNQTKELTALRPDGSQFPASVSVSSFAGSYESDEPGLLVVVDDISAKHELERLKEEFLSMMTHDLRSPLASIKCFLELIAEGCFDGDEDELKRKARNNVNASDRLIGMINSLLDLHKMEAGRLDLCMEEVRVSSIVRKSLDTLSALAERGGIPLSVVPNVEYDQLAYADEKYTVQVLINLVSNALKFSEKGSPVTILVDAIDDLVRITVRDKGIGIPKEFQSRLFNRFEQARLSDARTLGGSGLGLAISKSIVEQQGGTIGVASEPGLGCDFWFTLKRIPNRSQEGHNG